MCLNIYVGSERELPIIPWNDESPGFCLDKLSVGSIPEMIPTILDLNYYYDVGSFMGCSCGFSYGQWSKEANDNHDQRVKDVESFKRYLYEHLTDNTIKLFCTYWESFPDFYSIESFSVSKETSDEFDFSEDVILLVEE